VTACIQTLHSNTIQRKYEEGGFRLQRPLRDIIPFRQLPHNSIGQRTVLAQRRELRGPTQPQLGDPGGPSGGQRGNGALPSPPPQPPPHLEGLGEGVVGPLRRTARNGTGGGAFARTWTTEKPSLRKNPSPLAAVTGDGPLGNPGDRSFCWSACQQIVAERAVEKRKNSRSKSNTQFISSVRRHVRFLSKIQHYFAVWVVFVSEQ